jgi:succinyl-CoA synthetase beta subunit
MMLREDAGKRLFKEHGIKVPVGRTVRGPSTVGDLDGPVVVKALVPAGGRGKAGGVVRAGTVDEAKIAVERVMGMTISGHRVAEVYVEQALDIQREIYLALTIDRSPGLPTLIVARRGGVEVESLPPEEVRSWAVHPFVGILPYQVRGATCALDLERSHDEVGKMLKAMWDLFVAMDCELVEINPLIITKSGDIFAADAKVVINDDSLFRHPDVPVTPSEGAEGIATREGFSFVRLEGEIGVIANGAGLTMATLDLIALNGGRAGAFMDLGGTDDPERVQRAYQIMASSGLRTVLVNIFGGVTKCDTVAQGLLEALDVIPDPPRTLVRLRGVNEDVAREMLLARGIAAHGDIDEAVMEASRGGER